MSTATMSNSDSGIGLSNMQHDDAKKQAEVVEANPALLAPYAALVRSLVLWRNPGVSGAALAAGLTAVAVATMAAGAVPRALAAVATCAVGANLVYVGAVTALARLAGTAPAHHPYARALEWQPRVPRITADALVALMAAAWAVTAENVRDVVLCRDIARSARSFAALYAFWTLLTWVSVPTLAVTTLLIAFSVPVTYDRNRDIVDAQAVMMQAEFHKKLGAAVKQAHDLRASLMAKLGHPTAAAPTKKAEKKSE